MEQEIWKEIEGFEGLYSVSNLGNVKNNKTNKKISIYNMKNNKTKSLISKVSLKSKKYGLAKIVYKTFSNNYNEKMQIYHKDGDSTNNRFDNLYQSITPLINNTNYELWHNGINKSRKILKEFNKINPNGKAINIFDKDHNLIGSYNSRTEANEKFFKIHKNNSTMYKYINSNKLYRGYYIEERKTEIKDLKGIYSRINKTLENEEEFE